MLDWTYGWINITPMQYAEFRVECIWRGQIYEPQMQIHEQQMEEERQLIEDKKKYPLFFWKENI